MSRQNIIDYNTPNGLSSFELHLSDITKLEERVDVMAVSAFDRHYDPKEKTVIGALYHQLHISVEELAKNPVLDFRDQAGCWVSHELDSDRIGRIICVEAIGSSFEPGDSIQNLFAILSFLDLMSIPVKTLALPLLGAGNQEQPADLMIDVMLRESKKALKRIAGLRRVMYVTNSNETAHQLDDAMNKKLRRINLVLPQDDLVESLRTKLEQSLNNVKQCVKPTPPLIADLRRVLIEQDSRSFEVGVVGRRLAELVVSDLLGKEHTPNLGKSMKSLPTLGVAAWVVSYLHVLRTLGNESAHEGAKGDRIPSNVSEDDITLILVCVQRILDFWMDYRERRRTS